METGFQCIDPAELASIGDLQLIARTVVEGLMSGLHRSPHSGSSIEFAQYRAYAQGDDPRFVDWRLYGRTDRLYIKQYEEETSLRCTLLLDCSASMDYTSHAVSKFTYARMLAAALAMILHEQRDAPGLVAYHHDLVEYVPARSGASHLRRIFVELDNVVPEGRTDTPRALKRLSDVLKPRGMVVLISDLLHPLDEMIDHLKSLRARRHDVLVLQISDPAEQTFPFEQSVTFVDAETGREQFAVPDAVREDYLKNRAAHFDRIRKDCLASEIDVAEFVTTEPLDRALRYFLHHRAHALMTSGRTRARSVPAGRSSS
ncbi:MAG: DUF58 domain-containing protein [Candidatus Hydrogenedentes bacterium]|nr:DUF58 domain-containing protein [Candidatus Hydrogenedentota bacterium]